MEGGGRTRKRNIGKVDYNFVANLSSSLCRVVEKGLSIYVYREELEDPRNEGLNGNLIANLEALLLLCQKLFNSGAMGPVLRNFPWAQEAEE
ncbi:unnamed protein product [Allacma fusca]|uniref:Uncharacterized protein n=1 Tax=Allacma fusca TaxID=39272 RepID=A0A8J2PIB4_9HEXA|nr:unnamed protein product [Allacma fusca]